LKNIELIFQNKENKLQEKYVYKITNKINGKIYIGQTNNFKRRIKEHLYDKRKNKPIYEVLKKYGKENFEFEVLYYGKNYNNEEIKWIAYYNSTNNKYGYNIVNGGQDSSGEDNPMSKVTQEQVDKIIELLLNTNLFYKDIAEQLKIPVTIVNHINIGESWRNDSKYKYPLRQKYLSNIQYEEIISLLKNTNLSFIEIGKKMNLDRMVIQNINIGNTYKKENIEYPIRKRFSDEKTVEIIKDLLKNTKLFYKEIAKQTNTSISIVSNTNNGKTWINENVSYPIRNI
jgi:group I intron endonuclease